MQKVTISRETFLTLISLSKAAATSFEGHLHAAQKNLHDSPASEYWKESVAFWESQFQEAAGIYKQAIKESIYS